MKKTDDKYLLPTSVINCDHNLIIDYAKDTVEGIGEMSGDAIEMAVRLYYRVRDEIWYDPYSPFYLPEHYRASEVLNIGRGYCVAKAALLCALGRACGIPSRLGFATVRNHLATRELIDFLGSDRFVYHGYTEFRLDGKWIKATPAFNKELCLRHQVPPLEFNGREDSIFQPFNSEKRRFMEYIEDHGVYSDVPVNEIVTAWEKEYGRKRVRRWIDAFESSGGKSLRDFNKEEVIKD
jgi:transglutaminase-like putative cysteine protease